MSDLKPCPNPWCVRGDVLVPAVTWLGTRHCAVECHSCGLQGPEACSVIYDDDGEVIGCNNAEAEAIAAWNTRAPDPRITQLEADRAEAVTLLNRANEALNSAFAQADAEANGHDKIADRHSAVVRQFQSDVRATLSRIGEDGK